MTPKSITNSQSREGTSSTSRWIEDGGFFIGVATGVIYVLLVEILPSVLAAMGRDVAEHSHVFPWGVISVMGLMVAPKTLGRATAGKIWGIIGKRGS